MDTSSRRFLNTADSLENCIVVFCSVIGWYREEGSQESSTKGRIISFTFEKDAGKPQRDFHKLNVPASSSRSWDLSTLSLAPCSSHKHQRSTHSLFSVCPPAAFTGSLVHHQHLYSRKVGSGDRSFRLQHPTHISSGGDRQPTPTCELSADHLWDWLDSAQEYVLPFSWQKYLNHYLEVGIIST